MTVIRLEDAMVVKAPDGSTVHILPSLDGGSMAHFSLEAGQVSLAVKHRTVEEIWYVTAGEGQMWQRDETSERVIDLLPGTALTIPLGTAFQFKSGESSAFEAVAITMPPWPGEDEAVAVPGKWAANVE